MPGRKLGPWSEFPSPYRFTVLLNSGGSKSPWSEFWSEFPHFMGMGVVPAPSIKCLAHRNRSDFCDLRLRCPSRTPEIARFPKQETAMMHCDLRVRWKVASDVRFRAAISEPKTPSCCRISGDLAPSTRKSLAIAIVRFWCAKLKCLEI